jgi:hypothetical protein
MQRNAIYSLSVEVVAGYHDPWETGRRRMGTGQREEEDGDRSRRRRMGTGQISMQGSAAMRGHDP